MRWIPTLALLLAAHDAAAESNDLVLSRLATPQGDGTFVPQNADFRSLASELGVVLAPHMITPADTLGFGGFQLTLDYATTTIDPNAAYWRARKSSADPMGNGGVAHGPSSLSTIGFFARKGLWFPLPAFEVGAGAVHLVDSHIWTGQLYAKIALHEGYHGYKWLPSFAVRGGVSRMMSQRELDLTVASLDLTTSTHFSVGGTWKLIPFLGYNVLFIVPRSEVIDPTPHIDSLVPGNEADNTLNFVFKEQDNIIRQRFVLGVKLQYYVLQISLEASLAAAGNSVDDRPGVADECMVNSTTTNCDARDRASAQRTLSLSVGVDF